MENKNLIRVGDLALGLDTPVYRIMSLERLNDMFTNSELVLVETKKWEDPFENFFLNSHHILTDGQYASSKGIAECWFGQCWTLNSDTDAMWRIYSNDKQSVRVKTTIRKLANYMQNSKNQDWNNMQFYIGVVMYQPVEELNNIRSRGFMQQTMGGGTKRVAETLLLKRTEFDHEKEVRLLYFETKDTVDVKAKNGLHRIQINPAELIDEVCIDPRIDDTLDLECIENKIRRSGYLGSITQSELYKFDPIPVKKITDN